MDPLSITAGLLAVIGAAKAGANGVRKLSHYRKAPREVADLLSELESFTDLLTDIKSFTDLYPDAMFSEGRAPDGPPPNSGLLVQTGPMDHWSRPV